MPINAFIFPDLIRSKTFSDTNGENIHIFYTGFFKEERKRLHGGAVIHCPIGKVSFTEEMIADNFQTLIEAIIKAKPAAAKGQYLRSVVISSTMGPGVKLNTAKLG